LQLTLKQWNIFQFHAQSVYTPLSIDVACQLNMGITNRLYSSIALRHAELLRQRSGSEVAIEYLITKNRKWKSAAIERAVVDLLLQAEPAQDNQSIVHPALKQVENSWLCIKDGEIPEIDAADFSAAALREAISRSGYLIVRGMFAPADIDIMRTCVDKALNARADAEESSVPTENPWYYQSPYFPGDPVAFARQSSAKKFTRTGSFMVINSPRGSYTILEMYRKYGLKKVFDEFFGGPSVIATRKWIFRLVEPIKNYGGGIGGGWHQDGQFMGADIRALNMWIAMTECGEGTPAPGITLIPKRIGEIVEYGTRGAKLDWVVGGELVAELAQDVKIVSPRFAAGDALFFDHFSLHRSGHEIGQHQNRYALESWFYAKSAHSTNSAIPYF
jgi:hypothetical protein